MKFFEELKKRNVYKAGAAYLVTSWLLLQIVDVIGPGLGWDESVTTLLLKILIVGFPITLVLAWLYELTPKGFKRTGSYQEETADNKKAGRKLNYFIIGVLSIAVCFLLVERVFFAERVGGGQRQETAIAVIPFNNIKVDEDNKWLSQNFTQNVNTYLSKVQNLKVIDSYSSARYKSTDKSNAEIGKELDVPYILRGNVTQIGDKLIITVELIDVRTNVVDWSEHYDAVLEGDPIKLQQEVSQNLVRHLRVKLSPEDENILSNVLSQNMEANIYFNEGVRVADSRGPSNFDSIIPISVDLFEKAIELDPEYADAYAEMAFVLNLMPEDEFFSSTDKFNIIDSLLKKSLELDPNNARAYTTLGMIQVNRFQNYDKSKEYLDRALSIRPNDFTLHHYLGLHFSGKPEPDMNKALEHTRMAYRLNPFSLPVNANMVLFLLDNGKIEEAENFYKSAPLSDNDLLRYRIFEAKIQREAIEGKDWSIVIDRYLKEIEKDSTDSYFYRALAIAFNEVMNDSKSYLEYAEKAYQVGRLHSENKDWAYKSSNAEQYFHALLENKRFGDSEALLEEMYFRSLFSPPYLDYLEFFHHYYQMNYSKAEAVIDRYPYNKTFALLILFAQQNKLIKIDSVFNAIGSNANYKATVFAIQKNRDSMYHYLNKDHIDFRPINGFFEFDPYRNEDAYKALLKKLYLPITDLNN
jgi:TolB-like protein/Tfp pilus assembly protein PilF